MVCSIDFGYGVLYVGNEAIYRVEWRCASLLTSVRRSAYNLQTRFAPEVGLRFVASGCLPRLINPILPSNLVGMYSIGVRLR